MKSILIATLLCLFTSLLWGQDMNVNYFGYSQMTFAESYYTNDLRGLNDLMSGLETSNSNLYKKMNPMLEEFHQRNRQANKIIFAGYGSTLALWSLAVASQVSNRKIDSSKNAQTIALISLGAIVGLSSTAWFYKKRVNRQDVLDFVNQFNKHSSKDKIEFSVRPEVNLGTSSSTGLTFAITF